jgi:Protein of unknown function (DUF3106)
MNARQLPIWMLCLALTGLAAPVAWALKPDAPSAALPLEMPRGDNEWGSLSTQERAILQPLSSQWAALPDDVQDKWIGVARRYPTLSPEAQARVRGRMTDWSQASPKQRSEARLRFQNARELPADQRQQKWEAYQALPAEKKAELAEKARAKREAVPARVAAASAPTEKTNLVPGAIQRQAAPTKAVAPALVKAGTGATTSLVTESTPKPPLYQHSGMPRISATKTFVDPQTMLPKKGSQGAAMTPVATSAPSR